MSVIGLPVNLGAVADVAEKKASASRFALGAVEVQVTKRVEEVGPGEGREGPAALVETVGYRVAATDTKAAVLVEGECVPTDDVPGLAGVRAAPNSATRAMVPAKEFKKVFADADKATRGFTARGTRQVLASLSAEVATFGFTDTEAEQVKQTRLVDGRFPPLADVVADARKRKPVATFAVDPKRLADLAKLAAGFCDPEAMRLEVEVYGENKPLVMTAATPTQKVTLVLMPLVG